MQITDKHVVSITYTLKDDDGNILDQSEDGSFCYLHGASNIIPGLENALSGKQAGDEMSVSIAPEDGYGVRDDEKLQQVARDMFPPEQDVEAGMQFHAEGPDGQTVVVTIASVEGEQVTIDGNHPLAGVPLNFDVKVTDIRDATSEELEHGHAHGPEGHAHN